MGRDIDITGYLDLFCNRVWVRRGICSFIVKFYCTVVFVFSFELL